MGRKDKRHFSRFTVPMNVEVTHDTMGTAVLVTADLSDGGIFLKAEPGQCPPLGDEVSVRAVGEPGEEAPAGIPARVVRITEEGMGLEFL